MILNELFESGMKRVIDTVQDFVELTDKEFIQRHGISPAVWVKKNQSLLSSIADQYPAIKKYIPAPDAHLFREDVVVENLRKWFKEKWVRFNPQGKIMGPCARGSDKEGKPKCLPQAKAHALGKKGRASAAAKKRREDPNPERRGAAKNVATKEGIFGFSEEQINETLAGLDSDAVRKIQHMLNVKFDANLDVDGKMGPLTVASIKKFLPSVKKSSAPDPSKTTAVQGKESKLDEKQDACYHKVKSRYKVWPSAYASGALVQCRKKGAANWGKGSKKK